MSRESRHLPSKELVLDLLHERCAATCPTTGMCEGICTRSIGTFTIDAIIQATAELCQRSETGRRNYIVCEWVYEPDYGYGKALRVVESDHPRFVVGSRFDYGFLEIAVSNNYSVDIRPVSPHVIVKVAQWKERQSRRSD